MTQTTQQQRHNLEQYFDFDGRHSFGSGLVYEEQTVEVCYSNEHSGTVKTNKRHFNVFGSRQHEAVKRLQVGKTYLFVYCDTSYYSMITCIFDVC